MSGIDVPRTRTGIAIRAALAASWGLAILYVAVALAAMWHAPRVPYADGWGFLGHFASKPVVREILREDNGHHEVLPHAVRMFELRVFDAQQWLQVGVGIGLLLATLACVWSVLRVISAPDRRAAAMLVAVLGLCWLGNIRTLGHANETVHAYLVTLCVTLGIAMLGSRGGEPPSVRATATAALLGVIAAFSFSSGLAAFVALLVVALLLRARAIVHLVLGLTLAGTIILRRWSNAGIETAMLQFAPLSQLDLLLRWLAGPLVYAIWPVTDPALAAHVPTTPLRTLAEWMARTWHEAFGPVMLARWPHLLVGVLGICWLASVTWRARLGTSRPGMLGLGMAWFALAVGGMVAVGRLHYFDLHPDQLLAQRYLVWSSLFWAGLAIATLANAPRPRNVILVVLVIAAGLLPSQFWMWRHGESMREVANTTSVAVAVGVVDPTLELGETAPSELIHVLPAIQGAGAAMFAWPETALLGSSIYSSRRHSVPIAGVSIDPVMNLLGPPGRRVRFHAASDEAKLVLVDADGVARGIAIPDPEAGGWLGWMRGAEQGGPVRAFSLR
ncbi:hypothetical protein [Lysobacter sp. M15]|uniref:hypothetical protein n=1 Tax=Lysobacter sp. M15 TaxID=2916837 RepID=UPI001F56DB7B|nr:hypothetical protein [Lysobacter sp. M15]